MIAAPELKAGMLVMHSGEYHEVADVEVKSPIVRVATMEGGHIAFTVACRVMIRR